MSVIEIGRLESITLDDLKRVMTGYVSNRKYAVEKMEGRDQVVISAKLVDLGEPYVKNFPIRHDEIEHFQQVVRQKLSFAAYCGGQLVGVAIAERRDWNRTLWVWELGVAESHRRMGVGRQLVETLAGEAKAVGLRIIVCETQNTNVPAIEFYRKAGFELDGIDLSYYTNADVKSGEVALFMKRKLE